MPVTIKDKEYTVRPLQTKDLFAVSRILKRINLKLQLPPGLDLKTMPDEAQAQLGVDFVTQLLSNLGDAEEQVTAWLGSLLGMQPKEIAELELTDLLAVLGEFQKIPGLARFFELAATLTR